MNGLQMLSLHIPKFFFFFMQKCENTLCELVREQVQFNGKAGLSGCDIAPLIGTLFICECLDLIDISTFRIKLWTRLRKGS